MLEPIHFGLLVGKTVEALTFAPYGIHFRFEGDGLLTLESEFTFFYERSHQENITFPVQHSHLMRILQSSVTSAELDSNGDLQMQFSNGDHIAFEKPIGYEGYRLRIGSEEFFGSA
jgi:hypothetical protein